MGVFSQGDFESLRKVHKDSALWKQAKTGLKTCSFEGVQGRSRMFEAAVQNLVVGRERDWGIPGTSAGMNLVAMFGVHVPFIHQSGWLGIGISLVTTGIAAANLLVDFRLIENGVLAEKPKYMKWYCALGRLITLVWLYLEFLRLLSKLRSR